jgi:hypothetical protein
MVMAGVEKWWEFYCWSFVHLPIYCLAITITNEAYSVITDVDYHSTDSNSRLLNRVQTVILNFLKGTDGNRQ